MFQKLSQTKPRKGRGKLLGHISSVPILEKGRLPIGRAQQGTGHRDKSAEEPTGKEGNKELEKRHRKKVKYAKKET